MKYPSIVLWQQPLIAPRLNQINVPTAMLPVAKADTTGVWYTRDWSKRLVVSADDAAGIQRRICVEYGAGNNTVLLLEETWAESTEAERDRFLTAWSYCAKHNIRRAA